MSNGRLLCATEQADSVLSADRLRYSHLWHTLAVRQLLRVKTVALSWLFFKKAAVHWIGKTADGKAAEIIKLPWHRPAILHALDPVV